MAGEISHQWWKESVVYQIYPSSFKDSNGDGEGDIPGIISKVDYLASLGVDAVWLSPCYKSPQVDMGYDISDYRQVHEPYGTVEDVEKLIAELKKRNMKLLMDLVVNHTSDQHPWFLESKSSKTNPKRDWYIWREGKATESSDDGGGSTTTTTTTTKGPPNNWESLFKGSAWQHDATTDEYYFHMFMTAQPCLNWDNEDLRAAVYDDMHFWLRKGLGGLRMDAINLISKPADFPDAPVTDPTHRFQSCFALVANRPAVHGWLREMKAAVLDRYPGIVTVGECGGTHDVEETKRYIMPERGELDMIFQFELMDVDVGPLGVFSSREWELAQIKQITQKWQTVLRPAWNTFHLENHDSGRSVNRFGRALDPKYFPAVSKLLAFFSMTLGGTIFLHQGQEIGAKNLTDDIGLHEYKDRATHSDFQKTHHARAAAAGVPPEQVDMSDVMEQVLLKARDHARVPMAWDGSAPAAGFTTGQPWMTLNSDYQHNNVAAQEADRRSVLNTWRELIAFRKVYADTLVYGDFALVDADHPQVFAYTRTAGGGSRFLIALNWSSQTVEWSVPSEEARRRKTQKTIGAVTDAGAVVSMEPYACACWQVWWGGEADVS